MFGGKNEDGQVIGNLRVLKPGVRPLQWIHPETDGKPPQPRYLHSVTFISSSNSIFIFGGYNDSVYFNDGHIFNLNNCNWMSCKFYGTPSQPRASHCSIWHGSQVYIFGGINARGFLSVDMISFELDSKKVREKMDGFRYQLLKEEEEAKEMNAIFADSISATTIESPSKAAKKRKTEVRVETEPGDRIENLVSLLPIPSLDQNSVAERRMKKLTTRMHGYKPSRLNTKTSLN